MNYLSAKKKYDPYMGAASYQDDYQEDPVFAYQGSTEPVVKEQSAPMDYGSVASGAATGAAVGGPAGAAIGAGGSLLSQYIAQKAADERAKRQAIGQAYAKQSSDEQNILNSIMASNVRALR